MKLSFFIIFFLLLLSLLLFNYVSVSTFLKGLFKGAIIIESFQEGPNTSHTVNLPLNTTSSCKNFCGPNARCAITGQQCFADIDCPGCQPNSNNSNKTTDCILGDNDSGKLTVGVTPSYSSLTSGYGTRERVITKDLYSKAPQANFGVNTWTDSFNESQKLFDRRYKPNQLQFMPDYPKMYSLTGLFNGDGPLPSNY